MKISVSNMGPIKNGDLEIKPLTILLGPNNSGKTYMCYAIYYLLDWDIDEFNVKEIIDNLGDYKIKLHKTIKAIYEKKIDSINKEESILSILKAKETIAKYKFAKYIGANPKTFSKLIIKASVTQKYIEDYFPDMIDSFIMTIYTTEFANLIHKPVDRVSENRLYFSRSLMGKMLEPLISLAGHGIFFFPCFRNAISVMLPNTLFSTFKYAHTKGKIQKSLPKPIVDFVEFLTNAGEYDEKEENDKDLIRIIKFMDDEILEGKVETIRKKNSPLPEIFYNYKKKIRLDVLQSASAIQQIAPVALYIYTRAKKGDVVIIDEPEIHMHPQLQIKFAELATALVNYGLNVIISTHTPYIVDHINNLMLAKDKIKKDPSQKAKVARLLDLKASDMELFLIDKEKVGAYLFKNNSIKSILEDGEIDWSEFGNVSDHVSMIRDKLENL